MEVARIPATVHTKSQQTSSSQAPVLHATLLPQHRFRHPAARVHLQYKQARNKKHPVYHTDVRLRHRRSMSACSSFSTAACIALGEYMAVGNVLWHSGVRTLCILRTPGTINGILGPCAQKNEPSQPSHNASLTQTSPSRIKAPACPCVAS